MNCLRQRKRENKKTFFSWLGVSFYLYKDEIEKFLKQISSFAADGSTLLFDYADSGLFLSDVKRIQNMISMAQAGGEPLKSSFDYMNMESMLSDCGFLVYEFLSAGNIQEKYFRNRTDFLTAFENINYTLAVIKK